MQIFEIGSYKLVIKDNDATKENPLPHSAAFYKGDNLFSKYRSANKITPEEAMEFFLDAQLLKRTKQSPHTK